MTKNYLEVTQEAGKAFFTQDIQGEILMLNLLRFKDKADYGEFPELAPEKPITGREAYRKYMEHTLPFLKKSGGEVVLEGECKNFLIGPQQEQWDWMLLVRHKSKEVFLKFASDEEYQTGVGHRAAALLDSRLLPVLENKEV